MSKPEFEPMSAWAPVLCVFQYDKSLEGLEATRRGQRPQSNILPTSNFVQVGFVIPNISCPRFVPLKSSFFPFFLIWYYGIWSNLHHFLWNLRLTRHGAKEHRLSCQVGTWGSLLSQGHMNVSGLRPQFQIHLQPTGRFLYRKEWGTMQKR